MFGLDDLEWSLPRLQGTHAAQSWLVKPWPWAILRVYGGPTGLWWTQCQLCGRFLSHESLGQDSVELLITLLFPAGLPKLTGELAAPWSCLPDYCSIHQEWECLTLTAEHFLRVLFSRWFCVLNLLSPKLHRKNFLLDLVVKVETLAFQKTDCSFWPTRYILLTTPTHPPPPRQRRNQNHWVSKNGVKWLRKIVPSQVSNLYKIRRISRNGPGIWSYVSLTIWNWKMNLFTEPLYSST